MIYEVINPSDPITFEADSDDVAALATMVLGEGFYSATDADGNDVGGMFLFGAKVDDWLKPRGWSDLSEAIYEHSDAIAAALESCMVARIGERAALVNAITSSGGDVKAAFATFNEARRSSLNNICGRAMGLAKALRGGHR